VRQPSGRRVSLTSEQAVPVIMSSLLP
jgi:hypothetical protein